VIGFQLNDPDLIDKKKDKIINTAKKYFDLSYYYAKLFSIDIKNNKPILFVVCGFSGTGKSTISMKLSIDYHAKYINTDIIRKELEGIGKYERYHDKPNKGLYLPEKVDLTYKKVIKKASEKLANGENVVIDATFQKKKYRDMVKKIAFENNAIFIFIKCKCSEKIIRKRLAERIKKKSVSDGRWEIYLSQKKTFESFETEEKHIEFDTSEKSYKKRMNNYNKIISEVSGAI
jgi:predicted kinase